MTFNVVILAAGLGTRLARPHPKPLTPLADGRSVLRRQLDHVAGAFGQQTHVSIVVGYKLEMILEAVSHDASFIYNELFDQTNTSKSLLRALRLAPPGGVLWLNGDVVFASGLLESLRQHINAGQTFIAVNHFSVAEEEVKYTLDSEGYISQLSKTVAGGLGEAVGINFVAEPDRELLIAHLTTCADNDYFERGVEMAIADGLRVKAVDISSFDCIELDFVTDLERALQLFSGAPVKHFAQ